MIGMGIDQSFRSSGIVIMDDDEIIHRECFKANKDMNRFAQAHEIATYLELLINTYSPDIIAIEGLPFGMRGNVTRDLAGLQFVIIAHIQAVNNKCVEIIPPTSVKKFATGSGKAKKNEMIEALPNHVLESFLELGVKKTTGLSDVCDGYFILKTALRNIKDINKKEK